MEFSHTLTDTRLTESSEDAGIREILEKVINKVENMSCTKSSDSNDSRSNEPRKLQFKSNFSVNSSSERTKHRSGNRKTRVRHRKHKWKPYHKLSGDERRRLEDRISRRACRSREKMTAAGLTLAPYNTTQFLMDDHNFGEPDYHYENIHHESRNRGDDTIDSDEYYSSPDDEEEFIQQQFSEVYDSIHNAYLNDMSKFDLVKELMRLEDEVENMERQLGESCKEKKSELDIEAEMEKIQVFQVEIQKIMHENYMLQKENEILKLQLSQIMAQ